MTAFGILLIIIAIVFFIGRALTKNETETVQEYDDEGRIVTRQKPKRTIFSLLSFKTNALLFILGIVLTLVTSIFFYAKPGTAYAVQYLWGGDKAEFTQGIKVKLFGRTIPIQYEIPVQDIILKSIKDGEDWIKEELPTEEEIYYREAENWEFADAIKARIGTAVIVGMDINNEEAFLNMADRNKTEKKLVSARVMPAIDGALRLTCKLMDAQDYISGEAASFDMYFRDQLQNGTYILEEYYEEEKAPEIIGDSTTVRTVSVNNSTSRTKKYKIKYESDGVTPMRDNSNSLGRYGLRVLQAQITDIDWEQSFDKRLDLQKEQVAQTQLEKQEAEKEVYRAQKEFALGEANKAAERAKLEKEQIQKTIEAETKAKVATFKVTEETELLKAERIASTRKKVAADAIYYENLKRVQAGLTPQERAEWDYKTAVGVAREFKELRLPSTVIQGGNTGSSSEGLLSTLIGAEIAAGIVKKNK